MKKLVAAVVAALFTLGCIPAFAAEPASADPSYNERAAPKMTRAKKKMKRAARKAKAKTKRMGSRIEERTESRAEKAREGDVRK